MESIQPDLKAPRERLCQIITPVGMLGYGFNVADVEFGLQLSLEAKAPTAIILDSGSTDSGPAKLALGTMTCPRSAYERDLRQLIRLVQRYHVPLLISSAGGDGSNAHVNEFLEIIRETLETSGSSSLKVLSIYCETRKEWLLHQLEAGKVSGCGPCVPALTVEDIKATPTIVGQIGPEPMVRAMAAHPEFDILVAGRAYDPSPFVAFCAFKSSTNSYASALNLSSTVLGGFTHMGKLMECGGACATPKCAASMATIYCDGSFDIRPLASGSRCTATSVAAHALYEKCRPDILHGPGGCLDLTTANYSVLDDRITVHVDGSVFKASKHANTPYTMKFEGAKIIGHRTIFMGSFCDPILIQQLPSLLSRVRAYVTEQHSHVGEAWSLYFHIYGFNPSIPAEHRGEVFLVGEALAENQALATDIASCARVACVHGAYAGQKATSGNFGMGIGGKLEIEMGVCAEFSVYHLVELEEGQEYAQEIQFLEERESAKEVDGKFLKWEMRVLGKGPRIDKTDCQAPGKNTNGERINTLAPGSRSTPTTASSAPKTLGDIASVVRSKNAGPYEITLDVIFDDPAVYQRIKEARL
ncbi:hypothetical protein ASPVEDRAFT_507508 [Aspergillus versicolor CBS 583.65]|uniref:Uncharacterized protein n=1 Tax=Aspergillus versicolor CBS 583.65 TaxID=1036611 RepID=A0A1L9PCR2_ASPVE|nr:uncharacterized protein ASPVEDRAFT_507508 [Aspergillus versicolor CBS 583.65]OJI99245.1 hypothetical protein ASPVEDRAFT_507508 [Aspergillus versicolor CBS 583.65]